MRTTVKIGLMYTSVTVGMARHNTKVESVTERGV